MDDILDLNHLPYGSVVSLKGNSEKFMIIGVHVVAKNKETNEETIYNYSSVRLPKGYQGDEDVVLFNGDSIEKVEYTGYIDDKIKSYYEDIEWLESRRKKDE